MPATGNIGLRAILDMTNMDSNSKEFLSRLNILNRGVDSFAKNSSGSLREATNQTGLLGEAFHRVAAIVNGIIIADIFRGIARDISTVIKGAIQATADFQRLEIQLQTLAARDYMAQFGVGIEEALANTAGDAQDLLFWVRTIAVTTPFTVETLSRTLAMSKAFGFATEEAKNLVLTVGDFTAGMGLTDDVMKRIIYNLGQMVAAGKPTGRELRDLSNSFVPVIDLADRFAERLDKTRAEILEMFTTGAISAREFVDEFTTLVGEQFPGAMERMSKTFTGVANNINDFIQSVVGFELLGPVADKLATDLDRILKALLTPEIFQQADFIGNTLAFAYDKLSATIQVSVVGAFRNLNSVLGITLPTTETLVRAVLGVTAVFYELGIAVRHGTSSFADTINSLFDRLGTSLGDIAADMVGWGKNIIYNLAKGMVQGIVFIIQALNSVALTITKMLQSHSPPLLLPDLEKWGASAMMSYMEGWKAADFDSFDDIGDLLKKAIMSWEGTVDDKELVGRVIGSTVSLSKLTEEYRNFGKVSSEALSKLSNAAGFAFDEFNKFINLTFELQGLQEISSSVKSALDFSGFSSVTIFGEIVDSFSDLISLSDKFGDNLSDLVISYATDSQKLIDVNKLLEASQNELNEATARYEEILDALNAQLNKVKDRQEDLSRVKDIDKALTFKILTADERERLELEKKRILLERQIRDVKLAKDTELAGIKEKIDGYKDEKDLIEDRLQAQKKAIKDIADEQLNQVKGQLEAIKKLIESQIDLNELFNRTLKVSLDKGSAEQTVEELADLLSEGIGTGFSPLDVNFDVLWEELRVQAHEFVTSLMDLFSPIVTPFETLIGSIGDLFSAPELSTAFKDFGEGIKKALQPLRDWWDSDEGGKALSESVGAVFGTIIGNIVADNPVTGKSMLDVIVEGVAAIAQAIADNGPGLTKFFDKLTEFLNNSLFPTAQEFLLTFATVVVPAAIKFAVGAAPVILDVLGFLVRNADIIIAVLTAFKVLSILATVIGGIAIIGTIVGVLAGSSGILLAVVAISELILAIGTLAILVKESGGDIESFFKGIWTTIEQLVILATIWILDFLEKIGATIRAFFKKDGVLHKMLVDFIESTVAKFEAWKETTKEKLETLKTDIIEKIYNFYKKGGVLEGMITDFIQSVVEKFEQFKNDSIVKLQDMKDKAEKWLNTTFGPKGTLVTGLSTFFSTSLENFGTWVKDSLKQFSIFKDDVIKWLDDIFGPTGTLMTGLNSFNSSAREWFTSMFGSGGTFSQWFDSIFGPGGVASQILEDFKLMGVNIVKGLIEGLLSMKDWGLKQIAGFLAGLVAQAKLGLGEQSASKVFFEIGADIQRGLALGIQALAYIPLKSIEATVRRLQESSSGQIIGSGQTSNVTNITNTRNINVEMNAAYANYQSASSVYSDISAALSAASL